MNSGVLTYDGAGGIRNTSSDPTNFNGGTPMVGTVPLLSWSNVAPFVYVGGLSYFTQSSLCGTSAGVVDSYAPGGFPINSLGQLCLSIAGVIDHYNAGIPCDLAGRPVVAGSETPTLFALDLDHDGLPDALLSATPGGPVVSVDANSINVDLDDDGTADIVVPI